jgi:ribosomal protein L11 methyltransferase
MTVADVGSGSAILAIAAARLGAARVFAIELDPEAIPEAQSNIERNRVASTVHVVEGDAAVLMPLLAPFDLVVANILSSVHQTMLPALQATLKRGGRVVLAGMLSSEQDQMSQILEAAGWRVDVSDYEGDWWSALIARA